jgi:hypothetical protein
MKMILNVSGAMTMIKKGEQSLLSDFDGKQSNLFYFIPSEVNELENILAKKSLQ